MKKSVAAAPVRGRWACGSIARRTMLRAAAAAVFALRGGALDARFPASLVVRDIGGQAHTPLTPAAGDTHLLLFIGDDCPISNRYAPEIARIIAEYSARRVRTFLVYVNPALDAAAVRNHLEQFYRRTMVPAVVDRGFALTTAAGATVTPEAVVYTTAGRVYRGRIDDWYVTLGTARRSKTQADLRLALDAVLAGRPVPQPETRSVGCYIDQRAQ